VEYVWADVRPILGGFEARIALLRDLSNMSNSLCSELD